MSNRVLAQPFERGHGRSAYGPRLYASRQAAEAVAVFAGQCRSDQAPKAGPRHP